MNIPRRRRPSIWFYVAAAVLILWVLAYALDARPSHPIHAAVSPAAAAAQNWDRVEQQVEQRAWFSAEHLRERRAAIAGELAAGDTPDAPYQRAALARIDARLKDLR
jgi:hypothetical protein